MNTADLLRGQELVEHFAGSHPMLAGMLRRSAQEGVEFVPIVYQSAMACGSLPDAELEHLGAQILHGSAESRRLDVALLGGRGAAVPDPQITLRTVDGRAPRTPRWMMRNQRP